MESKKKDNFEQLFDRQIRIEGWQQNILKDQVALCLGIGGLGSIVLIDLLRLGVKNIILVDKDVVEEHNLNRQIIFSKKDIGISKVEAAAKNSEFHNISDSKIEYHHMCALKNWAKIVSLIQKSNVVFNMIDVGDHFDLAVQSACIKFQVPLIIGGTFSQSGSIEYYFPTQSGPCFVCLSDNLQKEWIEKLQPEQIDKFESLEQIPKNDNPIGQSNAFLCSTCGNLMVSMYINNLFKNECTKGIHRFMFYVSSFEIMKWDVQKNDKCLLCSSIQKI